MKQQIVRFLWVGGLGFGVDAGLTQALVSIASVAPHIARLPAIAIAVIVTFLCNRHFTFSASHLCGKRSFMKYVASTCVSQCVNYLTYIGLLRAIPIGDDFIFLFIAAGSVIAACVTFFLSRNWVFKT